GEPTPAAPENTLPQIFFLWAPINWDDCCTHFLCFERSNGDRFVGSQAILQLVGDGEPTWGKDATDRGIEHLAGTVANVHWAPGVAAFARRDAASAAPRVRVGFARGSDRARAAAHLPDARSRIHASGMGSRALARRARGRLRGAQGRGARQPRAVEHPRAAG